MTLGKQNELTRHRKIFSKGWQFLIIIVLIFGIFFRFVNLDRKVYWNDETITSLRLSGYTEQEVVEQVFDGRIITVQELNQYQGFNSKKRIIDTVQGLAKYEAQIPPLYFVLARTWTEWFGDSVAITRSLSSVISLLIFPGIYWLCLELFPSRLTAWIAVMLVAVSPFHVLYAQEARMYSLWTVQIVFSGAALLRAMRLNTKFAWGIYSITLTWGFYTHFLSVLVAFSQGIYVVIREKLTFNKKLISYLIAVLIGLVSFIPWIIIVINNASNAQQAIAWMNREREILSLIIGLFNNICNSFMDFWFVYLYSPEINFPNLRFGIYIKPLLFFLIAYSFISIFRNTKKEVWLFIVTLTWITPLIILLKDIILQEGSLAQARYSIACYLGIQIAMAYLLASKISSPSLKLWQKKTWQMVLIFLLSAGIFSCAISSQAKSWSNKYRDGINQPEIAKIINQAEKPLLISNTYPSDILSLSHKLDRSVQLQLIQTPQQIKIPKDFQNIFLYKLSQKLIKNIEEKTYSKAVFVNGLKELRQLEK